MCTVSYVLAKQGYQVFFNRDEQRHRTNALPPSYKPEKNAIFPIDPQGQGTWLAVHVTGYSLALLNYYQAKPNMISKPTISRGQIIPSLMQTSQSPKELLLAMDLSNFLPFKLLFFPATLSLARPKVYQYQFDGVQLTELDTSLPISSSSIDFPNVLRKRQHKYQHLVGKTPSAETLRRYHYSTEPQGQYSVNMCRADARTVSISEVSMSENIIFHYHDLTTDQITNVHCARQAK